MDGNSAANSRATVSRRRGAGGEGAGVIQTPTLSRPAPCGNGLSAKEHRQPHHPDDVRPVSFAVVEALHVDLLLAFPCDLDRLGGVAASLDGGEAAGFAGED